MALDQPTLASDTFGNYLKRVSRYPILTDGEVRKLSKRIKAYLNLKDKLSDQPHLKTSKAQCESLGITQEEFDAVYADYKDAKQTLIMHNIRFVAHIAKRYQAYGASIEDLVQEGTIGLNRATELFNPNKGYKFTTYAFWWIRQAITKSLNLTSKSIKMPPDIQMLLKKIKQTKADILRERGYSPSIAEIAAVLNKSQNRIYQALNCTKEFLPMDVIENQSDFNGHKDVVVGTHAVSSITPELIAQLSRIQQYIVIRKFGLDGESPSSYKEIAKALNCSSQVILKERTLAFDKLKELCA
jgi:DNA-directed RNA polymerase sigma subunit (sigma70/sigma32)